MKKVEKHIAYQIELLHGNKAPAVSGFTSCKIDRTLTFTLLSQHDQRRVKCVVILILGFYTVQCKYESVLVWIRYCIHFLILNQYLLAAGSAQVRTHSHMSSCFLFVLEGFFFFLDLVFLSRSSSEPQRHITHHGYHIHIKCIFLLCYCSWLDEKQTQTITSLLDWSNVKTEVSPHCLDDLSFLKGCPSVEMDGLFQKREAFLFCLSSNAAGVSRIIRGQCDCVVQEIQNLRPSHLHLHYIIEYLIIGLCHSGSWAEWLMKLMLFA